MASEQTTAIVLRVIEFSETSLVVTLMTRDFGKVAALAKGARRPKSSFEGALDLLAVCRVVIIRKSADNLDLLTEAKLERRFRSGQRDLKRLYAGYYLAELLRELTDHHDPFPELFDLTVAALADLDADTDVEACLLRFELQLLRYLGHMPVLESCAVCGTGYPPAATGQVGTGQAGSGQTSREVAFGWQVGGVVCDDCRPTTRGIIRLRPESLRWMLQARSQTLAKGPVPMLPDSIRGELRGAMNHTISHLVGGPLRLKPYLT